MQSEVIWEKEKKDFQLRIERLTDALESARSLGRKQGARIEELEREALRKQSLLDEIREIASRSPRREGAGSCNALVI